MSSHDIQKTKTTQKIRFCFLYVSGLFLSIPSCAREAKRDVFGPMNDFQGRGHYRHDNTNTDHFYCLYLKMYTPTNYVPFPILVRKNISLIPDASRWNEMSNDHERPVTFSSK